MSSGRRLVRSLFSSWLAIGLMWGDSVSAEPREGESKAQLNRPQIRSLVPQPQSRSAQPKLRDAERIAVERAETNFGGRALGVAKADGGHKVRLLLPGGRLVTVLIED